MKPRLIPPVLIILALAACNAIGGPTTNPTDQPAGKTAGQASPTAAQLTEADSTVNMCSLMPVGDVQAKSPFQTPVTRATSMTMPTGCEYQPAPDAEEPVSIGLVITTFNSAADAKTALANHRQAAVDAGLPVGDIAGLGDQAFSAGSDEVGVHAAVGPSVIDANFKGEWPDTTDDAKVAAGTELVRTIISRLP